MTHPNTDQGVTGEDIVTRLRKQADRIGLLLTDPPQETVDGALMREAADEIASLKQRLESAEEVIREVCLSAECAAGCDEQVTPDTALSEIMKAMGTAMAFSYGAARTFLQEQEKQNG